jgi:hypothetical protein
MPPPVSFPDAVVRDVLGKHGMFVIQEFPDGQAMWGDELPAEKPYKGRFHMADFFQDNRFDIFTIRGIISKLNKDEHKSAIEAELYERVHEG